MGVNQQLMKYFLCTTNKDPLKYLPGEEMIFDFEIFDDTNGKTPTSCPKFKYEIKTDYNSSPEQGFADGSTGKLRLKASIDKPGFCYIRVWMCDDTGNKLPDTEEITAAAGVYPEQITQAVPDPEDFDAFWAEQLADLDKIPPVEMNRVLITPSGLDCFNSWDVTVACRGTTPSVFTMAVPKDESKKYPISIKFLGYGIGANSVVSIPETISLVVNQHGILNFADKEYYDALDRTQCRNFGFDEVLNSSPHTCYFKNMVLRGIQALRYAMTLPQWDGKNITLTGGSMGGFQATAVAALCSEYVTNLAVAITWICDLGGRSIGRHGGWYPAFSDAIRYFDTASFASRVKCPTAINICLGDTVCRASGECVYFNNLKCEKSIVFRQGDDHGYAMREPLPYKYDAEWNNIE